MPIRFARAPLFVASKLVRVSTHFPTLAIVTCSPSHMHETLCAIMVAASLLCLHVSGWLKPNCHCL